MIRLLVLLAMISASPATAACRQALALGLDVSGSVDSAEYRLQIDGLAAALRHADVRQALLALPSAPVRIAVFEWSGPEHQRMLSDWREITSAEALDSLADQVAATTRVAASQGTAIGTAMEFGSALLDGQRGCWKRTLDLSGDGKHNMGPHPRSVQARLASRDLTINGLVIGADTRHAGDTRQAQIGELSAYFRAWVLTGPDAFAETALGFEEFEAAMVRKLKRELEGIVVSRAVAD